MSMGFDMTRCVGSLQQAYTVTESLSVAICMKLFELNPQVSVQAAQEHVGS